MNTLTNYCPSFPSIDWNKQAREHLLPVAAQLAGGALVNYNDPTAFAAYFIARKLFLTPWNLCVPTVDAGLSKLMHRILPSHEMGANVLKALTRDVLTTAISHTAAYKIAEYAGYPIISPIWSFAASVIGDLACICTYEALQEDPFKNSAILTITSENFQKEVLESDLPVVLDSYSTSMSSL